MVYKNTQTELPKFDEPVFFKLKECLTEFKEKDRGQCVGCLARGEYPNSLPMFFNGKDRFEINDVDSWKYVDEDIKALSNYELNSLVHSPILEDKYKYNVKNKYTSGEILIEVARRTLIRY